MIARLVCVNRGFFAHFRVICRHPRARVKQHVAGPEERVIGPERFGRFVELFEPRLLRGIQRRLARKRMLRCQAAAAEPCGSSCTNSRTSCKFVCPPVRQRDTSTVRAPLAINPHTA